MKDFKSYMIKVLKDKILFNQLNIDFVLYCERYINERGDLPQDLYNHLSTLFWYYHD